MTVRCKQICPSRSVRALLSTSLKRTSEFGNKVSHLQIEIRNKAVLKDQFKNTVFHLQIGTRNKTVLIVEFGNSVFHLQIGTRNKTVLIN